MTIIGKLICWYKSYFSDLTDKEFRALRDAYKVTQPSLTELVLATYFRRHALSDNKVNIVCEGKWSLKQLYMLNIRRGRSLSTYEQHCMVFFMPVGGMYHFPAPLEKAALTEMFDNAPPYKIAAYARDFVLPEEFERRLVGLCQREQSKPYPINNYRGALLFYLLFCHGKRLVAADLQKAVLALREEKLSTALVRCCSLEECVLDDEVVAEMVAAKDVYNLNTLLFHSYIASKERMIDMC